MLIGIDNVIDWIETNKTAYWQVKSSNSEKSNLIFSARPEDDGTTIALEDSKTKLRRCLETMAPGNYAIQAWATAGQKKGWTATSFQITNSPGSNSTTGIHGSGNAGMQYQGQIQDVQKMIEEALDKERTKNKIERLEADITAKDKRIQELESELNSASIRIGDRFDKVFGGLGIGMDNTQKPASVGNIEDDSNRIGATMERWATIDHDFENVLNGIVNLAETNPAKYQMGKNILRQ